MTIPEIKARLPLAVVMSHYGWTPDGRGRMRCPFHDDRTASMQAYPDTGTVYCFAAGCPTHPRSLDVIDVIKEVEGCTKHEAILKAKAMAGALPAAVPEQAPQPNRELADEAARSAVLQRVWATMTAGAALSTVARAYLTARGLDAGALGAAGAPVGYNSGQMHYGKRRDEALVASCLRYGLLSDTGRKSRTGGPALRTFARDSIAFALRTESGDIGGLYFRAVGGTDGRGGGKHFYLRDRRGLWPRWPVAGTRRVLLCESVVDAASVVQDEAVTSGWAVVALYGTNGWTAEHDAALDRIERLEEVCLMMDGDGAGRVATETHAARVRERWPGTCVTAVELPEGEDANGVLVASGTQALREVISGRHEVGAQASPPTEPAAGEVSAPEVPSAQAPVAEQPRPNSPPPAVLDESDPHDLGYRGRVAGYRVKGYRTGQLDTLRVTVRITKPTHTPPNPAR